MGLLSARGFRNILIGAGQRYDQLRQEALTIGEEGAKNLREISTDLDGYVKKSQNIINTVRKQNNPLFSKFLANEGFDSLMQTGLDADVLRNYKEEFDNLSPKARKEIEEGPDVDLEKQYGESYALERDGLINSLNMGNDTANFLLDFTPRSKNFRRKVEKLQEDTPELNLAEQGTFPTSQLGTAVGDIATVGDIISMMETTFEADPRGQQFPEMRNAYQKYLETGNTQVLLPYAQSVQNLNVPVNKLEQYNEERDNTIPELQNREDIESVFNDKG